MSFESHVGDETLLRWACNELNAAEQAVVMAHLEECEDCREVWRAVQTVRHAAAEFDPGAVLPVDPRFIRGPSARWSRWSRLAAAASLVAALGASVLMWMHWARLPEQAQPDPTAPGRSQVVRSISRQGPIPLAPAEASRVRAPEFSWQGALGASSFSVELLDDLGELIWTSERLVEFTAGWPDSVPPKPGRYFWRVSAHFEDGEESIDSPLVSFHCF